ncbi:MAG TPA: DUF1573 domain-containing protein [Opitutaceae bacterium]|nr:DUF1573 domain-containing protein [Opitutaceae bacterium]
MKGHLPRWQKAPALALTLILTTFASLCSLSAKIVWSTQVEEIDATSLQESVSARFDFRIEGKKPVKIISIDSGCSCTVARDALAEYAPGQQHSLTFDFTIGGRIGRQEREILLVTDESPQPQKLTLIVNIEELAKLSTRLLVWKIAESGEEKSVDLIFSRPGHSQLDTPKTETNDFAIRLETSAERPGHIRIHVKPLDTSERRHGVIRFPVHIDNQAQTLSLFVAVR